MFSKVKILVDNNKFYKENKTSSYILSLRFNKLKLNKFKTTKTKIPVF